MPALRRKLIGSTPLLAFALVGCLHGTKTEEAAPPAPSTSEKVRASIARMSLTSNPTPDGFAVRLDVKPLDSLGAPGSRCLVVATVTDADGQPRRQKKIEWSLDGVGEIASVDTGSYLSVLEKKPQAKFAVSYTAALPHTIKGEAGEDVYVQPGQTWCVLTSDAEGDARLTVHAPEISAASAREAFVTRRWADVAWVVPPSVAARLGEQPVLATQVMRASDRQPAPNYRVRYRLVDGPPALFAVNRLSESEVPAVNGSARTALFEPNPRPGHSRVQVELLRINPAAPETEPTVVARGETVVHWEAAQVALNVSTPSAAVAGQELPVTLTVTNAGQIPTSALAVRMPAPEGALFIRSDPTASDDGGQLRWNLPSIAGGGSTTVRAVFKTPSPTVIQFAASVQGLDGLFVQERATTRVAVAQLLVNLQAPPTAAPNDTVTYEATVTNGGSGTASNVVVQALYDEGLEHASQAHPLEVRMGNLEPGKSRTVPLALTPRQTGAFRVRLTATADGNLHGEALHTISVAGNVLTVAITGPATRYADRTGTWEARIGNPGTVPMTNVMLKVQLPPEVECRSASDNGQYTAREAIWTVGSLLPNEQKTYQVTGAAIKLTLSTQVTATVTADGVPEQTSIAPLEVLGAPAVRVEIAAPGATAPLKTKMTYRIIVRNAGSLAARGVSVTAELTPGVLRPLAATGPTIGRVAGDRVTFEPLDRLEAKQDATFLLEAEAGQLGDGRIRISVKSDYAQQPIQVEEATKVIPAPVEKVQGNTSR